MPYLRRFHQHVALLAVKIRKGLLKKGRQSGSSAPLTVIDSKRVLAWFDNSLFKLRSVVTRSRFCWPSKKINRSVLDGTLPGLIELSNTQRCSVHMTNVVPPGLLCSPQCHPAAQIYRASHAHAYVLVFKAFKSVVDTAGDAGHALGQTGPQQILDGPTCYALELLLLLLGLYWMQNDMGDFVEDGKWAFGYPVVAF